jgi:integrase/recombinase XerC
MASCVVHVFMSTSSHYTTWLKASGTPNQVIRVRMSYLNRLAAQNPGRRIESLGVDELLTFLAKPEWKPETRRSARSAIRSYFRWAMATERITKDPSQILPIVRIPETLPHPTPDRVFREAIANATERERLMIYLGAYAGLRRSEISKVHSSHVDHDHRMLTVIGKGGKERRIPLVPELLRLIEDTDGYVFPGNDNGHLSPGWVGTLLSRLLGPGWVGHSLRHRFATRGFAAERDLLAMQILLGHVKPETTRRYTQIPNDSLWTAVLAAAA